jgi:putative tricarboxylic transport membrane protein
LADGIGLVPVAVGLFGISEILLTSSTGVAKVPTPKLAEMLPTRTEMREAAPAIGRGTIIGFLVGIIPGSAHILSTFVSYAVEKRVAKRPEEFGQGAVAGVAGPESANNAAASGAFVPMLALGVPSGPIPAVMLAALMVHGVAPGPLLIEQQPALFWGFIASMYVGNLVLLILNLPLIGVFLWLLRIPYAYLYPAILVFSVLGVYAVNQSTVEVWLMLGSGVLGYGLRKCDFEVAPVILGLILSPMVEMALRQSLGMSNGSYAIFVMRPISLAMLSIALALIAASLVPALFRGADLRRRLALTEGGKEV